MRKLLISDLDGTLLGDEASLHTLLNILRKPDAPVLTFATGRQGFSAIALLHDWKIDMGSYLIAGVGTELYRRVGRRWIQMASWPRLQSPWDVQHVRRQLDAVPGLVPQPLLAVSPYKASYFAPPHAVNLAETALRAVAIDATIVHSHGNLLDVLPSGIDKGAATMWLARRLAVTTDAMMTLGDTSNDLAMLRLPCPSVIVGNAEKGLLAAAGSLPNTFISGASHAAGIIEGLNHFGWLNGLDWST